MYQGEGNGKVKQMLHLSKDNREKLEQMATVWDKDFSDIGNDAIHWYFLKSRAEHDALCGSGSWNRAYEHKRFKSKLAY